MHDSNPSPQTTHPVAILGVLALVVAVVTSVLAIPPADAAGSAPTFGVSEVDEAVDFATTEWADPWDFSSNKDLPNHEGHSHFRMSNVSRNKGIWKATTEDSGYVRFTQSWDVGGIPWGRDGALHPVDASKYQRVSFRMKTSLDSPKTGGRILWQDCGQLRPECSGGTKFVTQPGWHTYDVLIERDAAYPVDWNGMIRGFAMMPSRLGTNIELDWVRLYDPSTAPAPLAVNAGSPAQLYWDKDTNPNNNTADNANWGPIGNGGSATFDAASYPPGNYHFYTNDGSGPSAYSQPFRIDARPRLVVINPDITGGADFAKAVRKNEWDFEQANDVASTRNAKVTVSDGLARGVNATPDLTDSGVHLGMDGKLINTSRYHRLTMKVFLSGKFDLSANPGGGMNARLIWHLHNQSRSFDSDDIVVTPGWNIITLDLANTPANELIEPYVPGAKWKGLSVDMLRIDPHEDAGKRAFKIDWVKLSRDDKARNGKFTVAFKDKAYEPGSTVEVFVDDDKNAANGVGSLATSQPLVKGKNTLDIFRANHGKGTKWIFVRITDPSGTVTEAYSTGPVKL